MADTTGSPPRATGITEILTKKTSRDEVKLSSAARSISPPPTIRSKAEGATSEKPSSAITPSPAHNPAQLPPRKVRKEPLNPRMLPKSPANHSVRSAILDKLFSTMTSLNEKLIKEKSPTNKCFVLTRDELVTMALDEEEKVAKDNGGLYSNVIKLRIVKLTKMTLDEWTKDVMAHLNARYYKIDSSSSSSPPTSKSIKTGLTVNEEVAVVSALVTPLHGLEEFGYVTRAPTDSDLEIAKKGVAESKGWEKCDRCGGRFQVFPGRREDGALASGGECTYHPDRPIHPPRKRTDNVTGSSESYFPCCGESLGASPGCTKSTTHVFKVSEPKRLASILQFKPTPVQPEKGIMQPVCMDCEMGYTTLGLEMIRLTAVSWPEGHDLLDVLVKPMGEVLDLNSRFSGVFPEHYASATPYGTAVPNANPTEQSKPPLQFVESPAAARELLFGIIQPETPLIGHAIDNDLNVCRIIHPTVIDTVLLYPHPRGRLPYRLGLKALARKFLEREIQTGGDRGHDSKEDSLATGDLVRVKVGEAWNRLKGKGWRIENQSLVPPPGQRPQDAQQTALGFGPGVGQKRKNSTSTG
ncbi:RNA exonuclease 3 [Penicillium capsulatum]|uniref:RNA exonuclease 3 n=1 Tax=Penicillium capsulatum TaxID=69766 RepID=A0A9W9HTB9_9EURO|nr:RNA exonuclease 3 [Penicillium capsulatum]